MCGLAGIIDRHGSPSAGVLRRMAGTLAHRGPDSEGVFVSGPVGLAHRRLSILDLSDRAGQPMRSDDGTQVLVYNGEIYNYRQFRESLLDKRALRTSGDTEVLLRYYEERGTDCLKSLNGMFAFAILDQRAGEVVLACDPWGIKPLYYASDGRRFYFASEVKAILAAGFSTAPDQLAVLDNVFTAWTADERTLFKGVSRLPAGYLLRYKLQTHTFTVEQFSSPTPDWSRAEELGEDHDRWVDAVDAGLTEAVSSQLVSDVPVGTFCSGGLDSSLVTAIAAKLHPDLHTFNVSCPDSPEEDEGPFAERLAANLGLNLHRLELTRENFRQAMVQSVYWQETPLMVVNAVAMHQVSALARQKGMRVLLTGEGADETFGGYMDLYRRHAVARVIRSYGKVVGGLIGLAVRTIEKLGSRLGFTEPADPGVGAHQLLIRSQRLSTIRKEAEEVYARLQDTADRALAAELLWQLKTYLPPLLHRADRASMGASIELRVPFLDGNLASLALAVPPRFKVGVTGFRPYGKRILKEVAVRHIPADLAYRPKMGFEVPSAYYLGAWPRQWMRDGFVASEFGLKRSDLVEWVRARTDQSACWMLTLEMWGQLFFRGRSVDEVSQEFLGADESHGLVHPRRTSQPASRARACPGTDADAGGGRSVDENRGGKGTGAPQRGKRVGELGVIGAGEALPGLASSRTGGLGTQPGAAMTEGVGEGLAAELGLAFAGLGERLQEMFFSTQFGSAIAETAMLLGSIGV